VAAADALVFVGDRCGDHSPSGGYDQLCTLFPETGWLSGRSLAGGALRWIREPAEPADLSRALFHVLYGDCSGRGVTSILRERWPQATVVATAHQPAGRLAGDPAALRSLSMVDEIICVCQEQARVLARFGLSASMYAVPHGVWTTAFHPVAGGETGAPDTVLLVGTYLRDWQLSHQVITRLADAGVRSVVVGSTACERLAIKHPLVRLSPRLPEAELARHYHRSAALLLAVHDATASNALLEAMAAGCPVICSRLPSLVEEYLGDECDAFEHRSCDGAVDRVLRYINDPARRSTRAHTLIRRAQRFDWGQLLPRYALTYEQIRVAAATRRPVDTAAG
jgi:glycosyltransferase involved in cell wall biosynthesis